MLVFFAIIVKIKKHDHPTRMTMWDRGRQDQRGSAREPPAPHQVWGSSNLRVGRHPAFRASLFHSLVLSRL